METYFSFMVVSDEFALARHVYCSDQQFPTTPTQGSKENNDSNRKKTTVDDDSTAGESFTNHLLHEGQYSPENTSPRRHPRHLKDNYIASPVTPTNTNGSNKRSPTTANTGSRRPRHLKDNYISPVATPNSFFSRNKSKDLMASLSQAGQHRNSPFATPEL